MCFTGELDVEILRFFGDLLALTVGTSRGRLDAAEDSPDEDNSWIATAVLENLGFAASSCAFKSLISTSSCFRFTLWT